LITDEVSAANQLHNERVARNRRHARENSSL
jgi:hypothetical protein